MHELTRLAYLAALGIDTYVPRRALPGAAPSRRLVLVRRDPAPSAVAAVTATPVAGRPVAPAQVPADPVFPAGGAAASCRFTLAVLVAGDWLWLEQLETRSLAEEQVWLVHAMAHACRVAAGGPGTGSATNPPQAFQFNWPMHSNPQLDNGETAARASLAAFLARRIEEFHCRGVVLLGEAGGQWVHGQDFDLPLVPTRSTAEVLAQPSLKRQVWADLLSLRRDTA